MTVRVRAPVSVAVLRRVGVTVARQVPVAGEHPAALAASETVAKHERADHDYSNAGRDAEHR